MIPINFRQKTRPIPLLFVAGAAIALFNLAACTDKDDDEKADTRSSATAPANAVSNSALSTSAGKTDTGKSADGDE